MRRSELFLPLRFFLLFFVLLLLLLFFAVDADGGCGDGTELFMRQLRPAPLLLLLLLLCILPDAPTRRRVRVSELESSRLLFLFSRL